MKEYQFLTDVQNYLRLKEERDEFLELRNSAFNVFSSPKNENFVPFFKAWSKLCDWHCVDRLVFWEKLPNFEYIEDCFDAFAKKTVTYEDFRCNLGDMTMLVNNHKQVLDQSVEEKYNSLKELYEIRCKESELEFDFKEAPSFEWFLSLIGS